MAKIPFGILGPVIGTIGPVIGKTWKDKATLSSARNPAKTDKNPTPAQLNQREKFGFVNRFLHGLGPLVKQSFKELANGKTEFQCAVAYNVSNAVSGVYPNYTLHYELVSVGRGTLPNAVLPEAKPGDTPGEIRFVWADNTGIGTAAATDTAIAVIYLAGPDRWAYTNLQAKRSDCSITHAFGMKGTAHTWLVFVSDNGKASDSVYTGALVL
ncbi:MAG TPA: DUF6266 family protein [Chitinophagaceae bacterium]|nr:DUF6266 family protein [Chitinophagaceae bacterium]